jgi:hypothetical protein
MTHLIDEWLNVVREQLMSCSPHLISMYEIYAGEARFGREFINEDLLMLPDKVKIIEVGAGCYLLSCQLCLEGFDVTALEPVGLGFGHFDELQKIVMSCAVQMGCTPTILECTAENLLVNESYGYAFSINVMEHIKDWRYALQKIMHSLHEGSSYHFICPNYTFPWESHFNIPIFLSKKITKLFYQKKIIGANMPDPAGTWDSLNWINYIAVLSFAKKMNWKKPEFNPDRLKMSLLRACNDLEFSRRLPNFLRNSIKFIVWSNLHLLSGLIPVFFQPVIDCKLTNSKK